MKEIKVNVVKDINEGVYVFFTTEKGGALISNPDLEEGKKVFEDAMYASIAVYNLGVFAEGNRDKWVKDVTFTYKPIKEI